MGRPWLLSLCPLVDWQTGKILRWDSNAQDTCLLPEEPVSTNSVIIHVYASASASLDEAILDQIP